MRLAPVTPFHDTPSPMPPSTPPGTADSATLLKLVFDHAGEGISVFDAGMRLVAWNPRFLDGTGLLASEVFEGAPLLDLLRAMAGRGEFGPCDVESEARRRLLLLRDAPASLDQRRRPDGRVFELRRNPTPDGGFVMLYADITERVATQRALADEQRMLALLQQQTEQGFWFIDNGLRTTDVNPAMCRMLGLTREQMLGHNIYDFVDEENAEIFREHVRRRALGFAEGYEITLTRADGRQVHCYNNATPIVDERGHKVGALGLFSDISPLKRAEAGLREAGLQLALKSHVLEVTLDSLDQGVLSIDAAGRINTWNRRALELLEIPEARMRGFSTAAEITQFQKSAGLVELASEGPFSRPPCYQRTRRDGMVLEVRTHQAGDGGVVRTYTDVTAATAAQRALRESETRFRHMADAAPALIWQSGPDGSPIWFNQRWLSHTGRTMEAELACPWAQRMHADDLERCRTIYQAATAAQDPYEVEFRLRDDGGAERWIVDHGIPRVDESGRFAGFVVYGWDVTERKAIEAALRSAKEEAERASRAKSEFLSRMSHELRTPLNAVLGFAQLLESDPAHPLPAAQAARVQELLRGGRHLLRLINDVLDLARIEAGTLHLDLSAVDLPALVADCLRLMQPTADARSVELIAAVDDSTPGAVLADPTRLKQVLLNLLSNAIKYNRAGGRVRLAWQEEATTGTLRIDIVDTGPGLSVAQQERLFQPFERLQAGQGSVEGAGIGLALSKWLVELMRGEIGVASATGAGSRFWVRLGHPDRSPEPLEGTPPGAAPLPTPAPLQLPATAPAPAPERTVLYIEDNVVNQLLMEGMLARRPQLRLLLADLPEAGLAMAAQVQPDLVLLDIQLPGMDGFEVLRRLRAMPSTRHLPVVAVSANAMQSDLDAARAAGFVDYVTKPLDLQNLLSVVDQLLR